VLSSKFETFGVVVIESMLFGKPVIVTRCGGPETLVDDKTGIIVEKEDEMALTNAMKQMVKNHTRYDNNYIRAQVIDKFGRKQFLQTMNEVYKKIA
jgi:glycosyltransferase involved in cell wall biosynthesis